MQSIESIVAKLNPFYIVVTAIAQQLFTIIWFGWIIHHIEHYYYAADKGVRRSEHVIQRYSAIIVTGATFISCLARSAVVLALVSTFKASTLQDYQVIALAVTFISMISMHRDISRQRPFQLLATQCVYEATATMLAAVGCYYLQQYKF
ncbi:unnamed protein product [Phytomonas sp. Hart1]|nr:unnamed protein product [Phytomonas sp. Hart1]|eukprot:CCW68966.1 unnamed protein product [Phytomonas sp. isolate Hart1]